MIKSGMGTPRSQKSPYFIEFTPEDHFVCRYLCRSEIDSKQPRKLLRNDYPTREKHPTSERSRMSNVDG